MAGSRGWTALCFSVVGVVDFGFFWVGGSFVLRFAVFGDWAVLLGFVGGWGPSGVVVGHEPTI